MISTETSPAATVGARTPARGPLAAIAAATVVAAVIVGVLQGSAVAAVLRAVLVLVLVPCALIDLRSRIIPNRITGPAAVLAIALGCALDLSGEPTRLLWAGGCGGFLLVAALVSPAGMGMGDVKLVAVMGLLLGPAVFVALLLALVANLVLAVLLIVRHGVARARKTTVPFGPFLAAGGLVAAVAGHPLIHTYLSLHR